jgi:hypothetical protein
VVRKLERPKVIRPKKNGKEKGMLIVCVKGKKVEKGRRLRHRPF